MPENKIIGYKKMFGLVLPDWVDERTIKKTALALLSVAIMFFVLIFFIWPNYEVVRILKNELTTSKSALAALKTSQESLDKLGSQLSRSEQDNVLSAIPQEYSPDGAIYMLRRISNDTGVTITSYSLPSGVLLDTASGGTSAQSVNGEMVEFATYPIKITVTASVEALLNFITKMESSLPVGVVSDLNLQEVTKLSKAVSGRTVQLSLEIAFFQSNLRGVNISKVQPFTEADVTLAKSLSGYDLLLIPQEQTGNLPVTTGSGSVFGF